MDTSLIVSVIIAVVAIVPGVWALVNQAKKDKNEAQLNMNKAAQDAAMNIIGPLQTEVARLQARVLELEKALIDKTTEIGDLMQAGIDKDSKIRTLEYNLSDMKVRLAAFENKRKPNTKSKSEPDDSDNSSSESIRLEEELEADKVKKEEIKHYTMKSIENLSNGSIVNNINSTETEE